MHKGLITFTTVLDGGAAGVRVTDMSNPPDARRGEISEGQDGSTLLRWLCGGQMASARTSCECMRREQEWTHFEAKWPEAEVVLELSGGGCLTYANSEIFWSTPEV